jgi:Protein of unknown function (DUF2892)
MNLGSKDRLARVLGALPLAVCSVMAPFPLPLRLGLMALPAVYLLGTALVGSCLGYKLMGRSTCEVPLKRT